MEVKIVFLMANIFLFVLFKPIIGEDDEDSKEEQAREPASERELERRPEALGRGWVWRTILRGRDAVNRRSTAVSGNKQPH